MAKRMIVYGPKAGTPAPSLGIKHDTFFMRWLRHFWAGTLLGMLAVWPGVHVRAAAAPDYAAVQAIFDARCSDCHAAQDPEGKLVLESFAALMKGGENGEAIQPGKAEDSLLVKFLEGRSGHTGKNQFMPPGKRDKLAPADIALIRAWIDAGAHGPAVAINRADSLVVPHIVPRVPPKRAIKSLVCVGSRNLLALARLEEVELRVADTGALERTLSGHRGAVNALAVSPDGQFLFAAGGLAGVSGEVRQWDLASGKLVRVLEGHADALYAVAISPDGQTLATGSYDQKIILWDVATGKQRRTLSGHNGCIYDLAFRRDGKILASASADRTVKLWDVATGERRDTFSQATKEVYTVAFSPDGKRLAAAGVDNRIRVWSISEKANETTNPLLYSRFAHEGSVLRVVYSPDGRWLLSSAENRTVKLWDAAQVTELLVLEAQPDWTPALAFAPGGQAVLVGRLDGTLARYQVPAGTLQPWSALTAQAATNAP